MITFVELGLQNSVLWCQEFTKVPARYWPQKRMVSLHSERSSQLPQVSHCSALFLCSEIAQTLLLGKVALRCLYRRSLVTLHCIFNFFILTYFFSFLGHHSSFARKNHVQLLHLSLHILTCCSSFSSHLQFCCYTFTPFTFCTMFLMQLTLTSLSPCPTNKTRVSFRSSRCLTSMQYLAFLH